MRKLKLKFSFPCLKSTIEHVPLKESCLKKILFITPTFFLKKEDEAPLPPYTIRKPRL